jgi:hypothetical protein
VFLQINQSFTFCCVTCLFSILPAREGSPAPLTYPSQTLHIIPHIAILVRLPILVLLVSQPAAFAKADEKSDVKGGVSSM